MKIVAVCACTVGIAHTYMAQEAIQNECDKRGIEVQVETQGGYGIENELDEDDVSSADVVILAIDVLIEGDERFDDMRDADRVLTVGSAEAISDPGAVVDRAVSLLSQ